MRKIFYVVLISLIFCLCGSLSSVSAESQEDISGLLKALEITDSGALPQTTVTRAEFAGITVRLMRLDEKTVDGDKPIFTDVPKSHWAYNYVIISAQRGWINGYPDGTFRPDDPIFINDAVKILLYVMGYDSVLEKENGASLSGMAAQLNLYDGINNTGSIPLARYEMQRLIYNALLADIMSIDEFDDSRFIYSRNTSVNILSKYYDAYRIKGIVNATQYASIDSRGLVNANEIRIDDTVYPVTGIDSVKLIGRSVVCFIKDVGNGISPEILWMYEDDNSTVTVYSEDFEEYSGGKINVNTDRGVKSYKTEPGTVFLYNNRILRGEEITERIYVQAGWFELLDNDRDGAYELIDIKEYQTFRMSTYDSNNNVICGVDGFRLSVENEEHFRITDSDDNICAFTDLPADCLINIFDSEDDDIPCFIMYSSRTEEVSLTYIDSEEKKVTASTGTEYKISLNAAELLKTLRAGASYIFYLDNFGHVAGTKEVTDTKNIAYLINVGYEEENSGISELALKMMGTDGSIFEMKCSDNISVRLSDGTYRRFTDDQLLELFGGRDNLIRRLLMYFLNKEGLISEIWLAADSSRMDLPFHEVVIGDMTQDELQSRFRYYTATRAFMNKFMIDRSTIIYSVPFSDSQSGFDDSDFGITPITYFANRFYNISKDGMYLPKPIAIASGKIVADILIWEQKPDAAADFSDYDYGILITDLKTVYDEDLCEAVTEISGLNVSNTAVKFKFKSGDDVTDKDGRRVQIGDIVRFIVGTDGYVSAVGTETFYDRKNDTVLRCVSTTSIRFNSVYRITKARVLQKDDEVIFCAVTGENGDTQEVYRFSEVVTRLYDDKAKQKITTIDKTPVVGDEFVIVMSSSVPKMFIYYN